MNKRIKIKEFLNRGERKTLEKYANVYFYVLINLLYNLPIDKFRLVINRKYIFFKNKKKIESVIAITKKLLKLNNFDIKGKFLTIDNDTLCTSTCTYTHDVEEEVEEEVVSEEIKMPHKFMDDIIKEYMLMKLKNESIYYTNNIPTKHDEHWKDKRFFVENSIFENRSHLQNYYEHVPLDEREIQTLNRMTYYEGLKEKFDELRKESILEHKLFYKSIYNRGLLANRYDQNKKLVILRNERKDKKPGINIFDEFLDIYVLFRLGGGKGGFGANLRNKKKKKKKRRNNLDASRNLNGERVLVDKIVESSELLAKKKQEEETLIQKLNEATLKNPYPIAIEMEDEELLKQNLVTDIADPEEREEATKSKTSENSIEDIIINKQTKSLKERIKSKLNLAKKGNTLKHSLNKEINKNK